jgi:Protein of unknown function (DUF2934)
MSSQAGGDNYMRMLDPYTPAVAAKARSETAITAAERHRWLSEAAYFLAERREFAPGHALDDWLAAEREMSETFAAGTF